MRRCSKLSFNNQRASHSQSTSPSSSNVPYRIIRLDFFPHLDAEWLYCLNAIDISYCGLSQVPDAIGCLRQLQSLNLEGNYFVSLLSLKELSKLVYLNLNHCMFLESLPQLPFPTALNWDLGINKFPSKIGLLIFNCPKLNERECRIAFSWLTQFIQANPQCPHLIHIVIPGSEIPSWFNNQSEGDEILTDYSPIKHDINNHIIGLVCCSVLSVGPRSTNPIFTHQKRIKLRIFLRLTGFYLDGTVAKSHGPDHQNSILVSYTTRYLIKDKTNHIWLTYFSRKLSRYFPDFHGTMNVKFDNYLSCGIRNETRHSSNHNYIHPMNSLLVENKGDTFT
ncbi:hypothetical protein P8452_31677 [Trifolium repens]|nr:hypothetical protein P8452_31677 [Trifolium repens]